MSRSQPSLEDILVSRSREKVSPSSLPNLDVNATGLTGLDIGHWVQQTLAQNTITSITEHNVAGVPFASLGST